MSIKGSSHEIANVEAIPLAVAVWKPPYGLFEHGWDLAEMKKLSKQYQARL